MNYTISMTDILLAVSVGCNLWFLFLLLYERIMDMRLVRFFKGIAGLWRSLDGNEAKSVAAHEEVPAEKADIIGKSRFRMASTRTTAAIPTQEAATIEKGIELSEEEATFDDGKTGNASRPAQVPEEKLDETFTSIPPEELGYGDEAEYPINKGIGRPVEFKGLKAQYLFIFCGGLLALFVLFVILYMVGIDQWICIGFGAASSSLLVWQTFALNARYGEHGLMKLGAARSHPRYLINRRRITRLFKRQRKEERQ